MSHKFNKYMDMFSQQMVRKSSSTSTSDYSILLDEDEEDDPESRDEWLQLDGGRSGSTNEEAEEGQGTPRRVINKSLINTTSIAADSESTQPKPRPHHSKKHCSNKEDDFVLPQQRQKCQSQQQKQPKANILPQNSQNNKGGEAALAVITGNPTSSSTSSSARTGTGTATASRSSPRTGEVQQQSAVGRRQMPKFLHVLCCCIRPESPGYYSRKKKNDSPHSVDGMDARGGGQSSPITQVTKGGQPAKSSAANIANDLRQRIRPDSSKSAGGIAGFIGQQKTPLHNNNNLTVLTIGQAQKGRQIQHINDHTHEQHPHHFLLSRVSPLDANKKCLIVDLDETLVHSSFKPVKNADFVIPVEIDNVVHQVYVLKRPHTDHFLERIGALFECVLFTASLAKYADPVADLLDKRRIFRARLFRESCVFFEGNYVKDLERLGRDLRKVVIIDNSPASYAFHPDNAIPVRTWFDDPNDTELLDLLPMLEELAQADDIYSVLGTVPPHQQPRCLTPSDDLIQPPPMASSSPITQVVAPNNGNGAWKNGGNNSDSAAAATQPQQPWKRANRFGLNSPTSGEMMRRAVTLESVPSTARR